MDGSRGAGEGQVDTRVVWHLLSEFPSHGGWGRLFLAYLRAIVKRDLRDLRTMARRWARLDRQLAERRARIAWWNAWQ